MSARTRALNIMESSKEKALFKALKELKDSKTKKGEPSNDIGFDAFRLQKLISTHVAAMSNLLGKYEEMSPLADYYRVPRSSRRDSTTIYQALSTVFPGGRNKPWEILASVLYHFELNLDEYTRHHKETLELEQDDILKELVSGPMTNSVLQICANALSRVLVIERKEETVQFFPNWWHSSTASSEWIRIDFEEGGQWRSMAEQRWCIFESRDLSLMKNGVLEEELRRILLLKGPARMKPGPATNSLSAPALAINVVSALEELGRGWWGHVVNGMPIAPLDVKHDIWHVSLVFSTCIYGDDRAGSAIYGLIRRFLRSKEQESGIKTSAIDAIPGKRYMGMMAIAVFLLDWNVRVFHLEDEVGRRVVTRVDYINVEAKPAKQEGATSSLVECVPNESEREVLRMIYYKDRLHAYIPFEESGAGDDDDDGGDGTDLNPSHHVLYLAQNVVDRSKMREYRVGRKRSAEEEWVGEDDPALGGGSELRVVEHRGCRHARKSGIKKRKLEFQSTVVEIDDDHSEANGQGLHLADAADGQLEHMDRAQLGPLKDDEIYRYQDEIESKVPKFRSVLELE